jgi:CRISPR system Cascade subunit CasD
MAEHLVFTLAATIASFGDVAGHERRGSWGWPGRSAILGLLAAANGIRRDGDFAALDALAVSVAVFEGGQPLRDYHTVQTVPTTVARRPQSRPEALRRAGKDANTTITLRDYRTGVLFGVAVTGGGLHALVEALRRPVFPLYLGRKSCPLSAPVAPRVVQAASAEAALAQVQLPPWHKGAVARLLYAEGGATGQTETRHDAPLDRQRWHFAARPVNSQAVDIRPEGA